MSAAVPEEISIQARKTAKDRHNILLLVNVKTSEQTDRKSGPYVVPEQV